MATRLRLPLNAAALGGNETISRAIEIRDGVILNKDVLQFQQREPEYPHLPLPA